MILSARSIRHAVLPIAAGLAIAACSERRSTGPDEQPVTSATTKLPALNIYDDPIIAITDTIWGGREANDLFELGYGITLHWPEDPAFDRVSDIILRYWEPFICADVRLYDPLDDQWVRIDAPWDNQICPPTQSVDWGAVWHVSEAGIDFDEIMLSDSRLHLGGRGFEQVSAQLVRYHDDYRSIRLGRSLPSHEPRIGVNALTWGGGKIWVAAEFRYVTGGTSYWADSIWAFDTTGTRVVAFGHDLGRIWGLEYSEGELWTLGTGDRSLVLLNEDGIETRSVPYHILPGDMTLAMGRLWIPGGPERVLYGYVVDSIFLAGKAYSDWTFSLPDEMEYRYCYNWLGQYYYNCVGVDWDGSYFYVGTYSAVAKVNLSGQLVVVYDLPVTNPWMLAWDGEAFWVVHNGPPGTESETLWLSRFRLP